MSNNTMSEEEKHLFAVFSANFNDGEPIETRVGSRDMKNVSVIVEFIKDYVAPYIASKQIEARIDTATDILYGFPRVYEQKVTDSSGNVYVADRHSYISRYEVQELVAELRKQQEEMK